jgi:N-hydroxyarylamine O-acetyltransferase
VTEPGPLDPALAEAYLLRLGFDGPPPPTLAGLRRLHRAHLARVPFENLDIHLGVPIALDAGAFAAKIALRSRGGFCFELNGAFAALLRTLGHRVELLEARVHGQDGIGGRFGHLCLAVHLDGEVLLADVGFGRGGFDEPIRRDHGATQSDTAGEFRVEPAPDGDRDLVRDGVPQYRFTPVPRRLADFAPGCTFHQSSESVFSRGTICTIRTPEGRTTLAGSRLVVSSAAGRSERDLDRAGLAAELAGRFGMGLADAEVGRLAGVGPSPVAGGVG